MEIKIKHQITGDVIFAAEIEPEEDTSPNIMLGLAVKAAVKARTDLAEANLEGVNLEDVNLEGANLKGAYLAGANFEGAYLAGVKLAGSDLEGANFESAYLAYSSFEGANLARACFARAALKCSNFEGSNLAGANFKGADLEDARLARTTLNGTNFEGSDVEGTNFESANLDGANLKGLNLADAYFKGASLAGANLDGARFQRDYVVPVVPNIDSAILSALKAGGTLEMSTWHGPDGVCGTAHCRAGWAVHLAGEAGRELEKRFGMPRAAEMIYRASRPGVPAPWFFAPNDVALADIREGARREKKAAAGQ
jgi:uncharacterized protein YjbI with pentapeptide repeats